ncbi:MAG: lamin tail domain-containing protein, partial [Anaerolineae bacterium]
NLALNNGGDWVRLLRPDGVLVEAFEYTASRDDEAYSKTVDGGDAWTRTYPPSPGASNQSGGTPTPTPTATVTVTATPGVFADHVTLNEFMPDPTSDWNGDGTATQDDEYIELYNANDFVVDLSGWQLDDLDDGLRAQPDGSPPYPLPAGSTIPPHGFLLVFASESNLALNNGGDWVRLLRPDGVLVEAFEYTASRDDEAYSKTVDGGDAWTRTYPPSPGASNQSGGTPTPTATPTHTPAPVATTVRLNEVLPSPRDVDWDGNGVPSYLDEWIELVNVGDAAVSLAGWRLVDERPQQAMPTGEFTFPADAAIAARGYLLIFRGESGLALDASAERLRLLYPDGSEADAMQYTRFIGYDQAWCRWPDGTGDWWQACVETPGQPNQSDATPTPIASSGSSSAVSQPYDRFNYDLLSIAAARGLPDRTRLTLEGQVTVLPNVFDDQQIYIQDASGGILVYLRSGEWPPLSEGQWVRVNGRLDTFYGEREIALTRIDDIKTMQPATPPAPITIYTGDMSEAREGQLVQLSASVTGFWREDTLYLDDGTGEARILIKAATGVRRPYVVIGKPWTIIGIVSQSDNDEPFDSGYRLLPRRTDDLQEGRATATRAPRAQTSPRTTASTRARTNVTVTNTEWNRAPLFLPVTGARLTIRPPISTNLRQAWLNRWW